jgi:hypothetical protein
MGHIMQSRAAVAWFKSLLVALVVFALASGVGAGPALAQGGAPSGWKPYAVDGVAFALPDDWQQLALSQAAIADQIRQLARNNPELAKTLQLLLDSGQLSNLSFLAVSAGNGDSANLLSAPLPAPITSQALAATIGQQLPLILPGAKVVKSVGGLRVGGVDAARVEFLLNLSLGVGGSATLRGVQFYLLPTGKLHVLSVIGGDDARLPTLADQIGATVQVGGAAPATANSDTRPVASGGNLRREPRIAANVIGQLCAGDTVAVLGQQGAGATAWLRVRVTALNGRCVATRVPVGAEGWASASLIGRATAAPGALTARVAASGNVRNGPGLGNAVIGQIRAGETVTLLGRNAAASWYRIQTARGITGWASATLLAVDAATRPQVPVL